MSVFSASIWRPLRLFAVSSSFSVVRIPTFFIWIAKPGPRPSRSESEDGMFRLPPSPTGLHPAGPFAGKSPAGDFSNELVEAGDRIDDRVGILVSCLVTRIRHQYVRHACISFMLRPTDTSRPPTPMRPPSAAPNRPPRL